MKRKIIYPARCQRSLIPVVLLFLFSLQTFSQVPNWLWAKRMGAASQDYGYSIATDASSNVYTIGFFTGTVDFDPGMGTFNLTSAGLQDIFISKLDASGNFVWAKQMGGTDNDYGASVALDALGNVYTTGSFQGTADFDPGAGVFNLTAAGGWDIFISKLDASGNFAWAKQMGGTNTDRSASIALDPTGSGAVYTTGFFLGTADFDPGAGVFNLTAAATTDIFISKLDGSGNFVWAKAMGGAAGVVYSYSIALDASGNVYTSGDFWGTVDFDPGAGIFNLTPVGFWDIFISKLDGSGNFVWAKQMGGTGSGKGYSSIASDASGNVYTTGFFYETVDFDPGAGTFNLTSASSGQYDIFISKLNSSGNFVWAKRMGGPDGDYAYSIALDAAGSVYTTGGFSGTVDFDPGPGVFNLTSTGWFNIFVSKLDGSGNFAWAKAVAGPAGSDCGQSIALDASGNVYVAGYFYSSSITFGSTTLINVDNSGNTAEIFIGKLGPSVALPVELVSFTGENKNNINHLQWSTASEINNDYFIVERSSNGIDFENIGTVDGHGNSTQILNYSFNDMHPFDGINYYRLKQVDFDSKFEYSHIIAVMNKHAGANCFVYAGETPGNFILSCHQTENARAQILDVDGKLLKGMTISNSSGNKIDLNDLQNGLYVLRVIDGENIQNFKLVKN